MTQAQTTQNPETQTLKTQFEQLINESIRERRTTVVVIRYRSSDGYYNYQTKLVVVVKPKLEWEEEEAMSKLVDIPLSIFDNLSLNEVENIIDKLKEQYDGKVYVEKVVFW